MAITPICANSDLEARYGAANVLAWADMEGTGATANAVNIGARKLLARTQATAYVYDRLRVSQLNMLIPITTVPDTLVMVSVMISGYLLSSARGVTDYDQQGKPITRWYVDWISANAILDKIVAGELRLDL
jgi:hypothetical protein